MRFNLALCATVSSFLFFGCSQNNKPIFGSEVARFLWMTPSSELSNVKVFNQFGEPIASAQILIGRSQGNPFKNNFITTDKSGVAIIPSEWATSEHVTVDASGYIRQTLLNQKPGDLVIKMNPAFLQTPAQIKGVVSNLPVINGDKLIDFGLVMPAMSRSELLNFDLNSVISPFSDTLTVAGQNADVPSNISLPTQIENYIFNLTISKPIYRMIAPTLGPKRFFAARGRFPFKAVINDLRAGKKFYELLNYFSIHGGGIRDITLLGPQTTLDIPGNEINFNATLKVKPAVAAADEVLIVVAVSEIANTLIPTDLKRATSSDVISLASLEKAPAYVVNVIKRQAEFNSTAVGSDRLSASLSSYTENVQPLLLPLLENPTVTDSNGLLINLPNKPEKNGINPLAVSAVISDLIDLQIGTEKVVHVMHRWEVLGLGWDQKIQLPNWPLDNSSAKKRVEINYVGSTSQQVVVPLEKIMEIATHVTHASMDF